MSVLVLPGCICCRSFDISFIVLILLFFDNFSNKVYINTTISSIDNTFVHY